MEGQTQTISISDDDVQRISESVATSCSASFSSVMSRLDGIDAQVVSSSESLSQSVASLRLSPDVAQTVSVSGSQWEFVHDSLAFQSSALLFVLALVGALVGVLVWREFSRGFRRA